MKREDGFTVIEVLVAAVIGLVVFSGAMGLMSSSFKSSYGVQERTDAMQRGRAALDQITQALRSQVCPDVKTNAVAPDVSTNNSVTFYADLSDPTAPKPPVKHVLAYDAATKQIVDSTVVGTALGDGTYAFTGTANRRVVLESVDLVPNGSAGATLPFLSYWAYPRSLERVPNEQLQPLGSVLTAADAGRVARIDVHFQVQPTRTASTTYGTVLADQIAVRDADPNQSSPDPSCS